jgi:PAS domain S-box-containing protein
VWKEGFSRDKGDPRSLASKKNHPGQSSAESIVNGLSKNGNEAKISSSNYYREELEQLFYNLFELTNDGIFIIGLDGKYIHVNKRGAKMLGYSVDELIGRKATDFIVEEEIDDSLVKLEKLKEGTIWPIYERTIINKMGEKFIVEVNASLVKNYKGEVSYIQTVARDITNRKKMENNLRVKEEKFRALFTKTQKQRDELESFATVVAHDLRNKLQIILTHNELSNDQDTKEAITKQIMEINEYLNDALMLARKGDILHDITDIDLNKLLADIIQKLISIEPEVSYNIQEFPLIKGDFYRLYQVFENLIINALQHAKPKTITIGYKETNDDILIYVKDDGLGISQKRQAIINESWTTGQFYTFGLLIAKKIIEAHKGTLDYDSKVNEGTTFYIKLPKYLN